MTIHNTPAGAEVAQPDWHKVEEVIIGEAANQGQLGMAWVACTMRERNWNLNGYAASRREDLDAFYHRQSSNTLEAAREALEQAKGGFDCEGADHYLTVKLYRSAKCPRWARKLELVRVLGDHVFFTSKRKG